jgi:hypothetical protein
LSRIRNRHHLVRIEPLDSRSRAARRQPPPSAQSDLGKIRIDLQPLLAHGRAHEVSHEPLGRATILGLVRGCADHERNKGN